MGAIIPLLEEEWNTTLMFLYEKMSSVTSTNVLHVVALEDCPKTLWMNLLLQQHRICIQLHLKHSCFLPTKVFSVVPCMATFLMLICSLLLQTPA